MLLAIVCQLALAFNSKEFSMFQNNTSILIPTQATLKLKKRNACKASYYTKPEICTREVTFNEFNIPETRQKRTQKNILSKILAFVDGRKRSRFRNVHDGLTVIPLSTRYPRLVSIAGSPMQASNLIKYMIRIGLLAEYDTSFRFNSANNYSKKYVYNYQAEELFVNYCKENNINVWKVQKRKRNIKPIKIGSFEMNQVLFSSKLHLLKPSNYSVTQFEDYLEDCLHKNYSWLEPYQDLADSLNEQFFYDDSDREITFKVHFEWNKGNTAVTKIGIRATNSLCNTKKEWEPEDDAKDYNFLYRDEVLKAYGFNHEYDVKSSVPRITTLLNTGVWLDSSVDSYEKMCDRFNVLCPSEALEWSKENRKIFKDLHMRGYFDTPNMIAAHIKREISLRIDYKKEDWLRLDNAMKCYKQAIEDTVGKLYDSEIFFHESCIYMDVLAELLNRGVNVLQIYDGFYTDVEVKDIEEIIEDKALNYYKRYINKDDNDNNREIKIINNNNNKRIINNKDNNYMSYTIGKEVQNSDNIIDLASRCLSESEESNDFSLKKSEKLLE